jgi:hypothetical protein
MVNRSVTQVSAVSVANIVAIVKVAAVAAIVIISLFVSILLLPGVSAMPSVPSEFRGWAIIDGRYAKDGTEIRVLDRSGAICGTSSVKARLYGSLSCLGDDPSTAIDEGATLYEPLTFSINGRNVSTGGSVLWYPGQLKEVNLILGDITKAELLILRLQPFSKSDPRDAIYIIFLMLLIIIALVIITAFVLNLLRLLGSRHKKNRRRAR